MDNKNVPYTNIRPARFSSFWYQDDATLLLQEIKEASLHTSNMNFLSSDEPTLMILPHSGLTYSKRALSQLLTGHPSHIRLVIIISPSHYVPLRPNTLYESDFDGYETPLGVLPHHALKIDYPTIVDNSSFLTEHAVEMILPILAYKQEEQQQGLHVAMFMINHLSDKEITKEIASSILAALSSSGYSLQETIVIASSDFTHYGKRFNYTPYDGGVESVDSLIKRADIKLIDQLINGEHTHATTYPATPCGYAAMSIVSEMARALNLRGKLIDYYTSKQIMQSDDSVSYATIFF